VLEISDARADAGVGAPAFADLDGVVVELVADDARVTVVLGADVPTKLAEHEAVGIGFDLYRTGGRESDYQLFADGGAGGWQGYLQTPTGFVEYPGRLQIGGRQLVFTVPLRSLGGPGEVSASVFLDYSKEGTIRNVVASDHAPDASQQTFRL
jgi:hypothetical protein